MIQPNELRIGNFYLPSEHSNHPMIFTYNLFKEVVENDYKIYPIPLTEEWLKDFGFIRSNAGYGIDQWRIDKFFIYGDDLEDGKYVVSRSFDGIDVELKYVHQLQNLYFALTGKELTKQS